MQVSSVPVFQSNVGITSPHYSFHGAQLDGMPPPYMNDQIGNVRPPWYEPFSARYILFNFFYMHYIILDLCVCMYVCVCIYI